MNKPTSHWISQQEIAYLKVEFRVAQNPLLLTRKIKLEADGNIIYFFFQSLSKIPSTTASLTTNMDHSFPSLH